MIFILELVIFNLILILIITALLFFSKRYVKSERARSAVLLIAALITILYHYSSLIFRIISGNDAMGYLKENPNLFLPIYPCNVVMWAALIFGIIKNKKSHFAEILADLIFWFGIFSTLVGMFANVDFIMNPTLKDYDIVKSIGAHATLLFNLLLFPLFGFIKMDFVRNMRSMLVTVVLMYAIGLYCNLLFEAIDSYDAAYSVNSMFIIHSPFDGVDFLIYPVIALIAMVLYFILFTVGETITRKKGERWYERVIAYMKAK